RLAAVALPRIAWSLPIADKQAALAEVRAGARESSEDRPIFFRSEPHTVCGSYSGSPRPSLPAEWPVEARLPGCHRSQLERALDAHVDLAHHQGAKALALTFRERRHRLHIPGMHRAAVKFEAAPDHRAVGDDHASLPEDEV